MVLLDCSGESTGKEYFQRILRSDETTRTSKCCLWGKVSPHSCSSMETEKMIEQTTGQLALCGWSRMPSGGSNERECETEGVYPVRKASVIAGLGFGLYLGNTRFASRRREVLYKYPWHFPISS